jgi:hypothetical protein
MPKKVRGLYTAWILFHMYLELPVRNEIATVIYKRGQVYLNNLVDLCDINKNEFPDNNYLIYVPSKKIFTLVRNSYKTSDKYDPKFTKLDKFLSRKILKYIQVFNITNGEYLFPELMKTENPQLNLTKLLTRISSEQLKGKKISSTLMTKLSISTPELSSAVNTLQQIADTRGTNVGHVVNVYANNNVNQLPPNNNV